MKGLEQPFLRFGVSKAGSAIASLEDKANALSSRLPFGHKWL
ncbi:MAG: hypothetical protein ACLFV6_01745 [Spirulinaceae cyanobacterium]